MNEIENARIVKADLSMEDHGVLTFDLVLEGYGWGCNFGGYVLGKGMLAHLTMNLKVTPLVLKQ